jgi:hypothetical protein
VNYFTYGEWPKLKQLHTVYQYPHAVAAGLDVAEVFRWVFVAALVFALIAFAAIILMEERPLHGPATKSPPVVPEATPAE